jgi:hypothetical protein
MLAATGAAALLLLVHMLAAPVHEVHERHICCLHGILQCIVSASSKSGASSVSIYNCVACKNWKVWYGFARGKQFGQYSCLNATAAANWSNMGCRLGRLA